MAEEVFSIATADGLTVYFDIAQPETQTVKAFANFGAPPIAWNTRTGYKQDGSSEVSYDIEERTIALELVFMSSDLSRQAFWDKRAEIIDLFRPNRGGQMTLTVIQPSGAKRAIRFRADPGFVFPVPSVGNAWFPITETISLRCFDPIWFDPAQEVTAVLNPNNLNLVFPITFDDSAGSVVGADVIFGEGGLPFLITITYIGNWKSFPVLTLTGPYSSVVVRNLSTNGRIELTLPITAGQERIITLTQGAQSIVDENGVDRFGELSSASDLVNFAIFPNPEVAGGMNEIKASFINGVVGQTTFTIAYNNRYLGI